MTSPFPDPFFHVLCGPEKAKERQQRKTHTQALRLSDSSRFPGKRTSISILGGCQPKQRVKLFIFAHYKNTFLYFIVKLKIYCIIDICR